jgi:hypothetical protein
MLFRSETGQAPSRVEIRATAFRDDASAEQVTITKLAFDRCLLSSDAIFRIGERLRIHVPGQGLIETEVQATANGETDAIFATECHS